MTGDDPLNEAVTREQLAAMLWRYAGTPAASLPAYDDGAEVAEYAAAAVAWAQNAKVMSGVGGGRFDPQAAVTRGTLAQILMNYSNREDTSVKVPTPATAYKTGALSIAKQGLFTSGGSLILGSYGNDEERNQLFNRLLFVAVPISVGCAALYNFAVAMLL